MRNSLAINRRRDQIDGKRRLCVIVCTGPVAPFGPRLNPIGSAGGPSGPRAILRDAAGMVVSATAFVGAGCGFPSQVETVAGLPGNLSGTPATGNTANAADVFARLPRAERCADRKRRRTAAASAGRPVE